MASITNVLLQPWILHGREIVLAAGFWTFVHICGRPVIGKIVPRDLSNKNGDDRGVRLSALLHAVFAVALSFHALFSDEGNLHEDHLFGTSRLAERCLILSCG